MSISETIPMFGLIRCGPGVVGELLFFGIVLGVSFVVTRVLRFLVGPQRSVKEFLSRPGSADILIAIIQFLTFAIIASHLGVAVGVTAVIAITGIVLFGSNHFSIFLKGVGRGIKEYAEVSSNIQNGQDGPATPAADALKHSNQTVETDPPPEPTADRTFVVWFAQGFGIGRLMRTAPGTWGSLLGLLWTAALLVSGYWQVYLLGAMIGVFVSVWSCGEAERILREKDPPSVVMDEIVAMPFCFFGILTAAVIRYPNELLPTPSVLFEEHFFTTAIIFGLFRLFDIWKPWPVLQSQSLPGGWGVTVDDLLAAVYVNLVTLLIGYVIQIAR